MQQASPCAVFNTFHSEETIFPHPLRALFGREFREGYMLEVETLALDTKFIPDNLELSQIAFREGKSSDIPKNIIGIQTKDSTERFVIENFWYCQLQGALPINKALVISPEDLKKFLDAKGLLW